MGVNSGPVVAGVIGTKKFIYDPHGTVYVKGKGEMEVWYVIQAA